MRVEINKWLQIWPLFPLNVHTYIGEFPTFEQVHPSEINANNLNVQ